MVFVATVAIVPATLTVPALGSMGAPQVLVSLAALGVWFVVWLAPGDGPDREFRPIPLLLAGFIVANLASFAAASLRPADFVERTAADRGVVMIAAAGGIALLTAETVRSRDRLQMVLSAAVLAGAFIASVGIVQFVTGSDPAAAINIPGLESLVEDQSFIGERSIFRRVSGTTTHAIEFSAALCIVLPIAIHLLMSEGRRWLVPTLLIGVALPMSVSRTAVVGLAAVVLVLIPSWPQELRRRAYIGGLLYLVSMRLMVPGLLGTIRSLFVDAGVDPSVESRRTDYEFVERFVSERPLFGRGFATFIPTRYDFLDNQYLLSLVETGAVGLAAYISLLVGGIVVARSIRRRASSQRDRDLAQALAASLAVVAATSFAFDFLSFGSARALMFLVLGCIGALWRIATSDAGPTPVRPSSLPGRTSAEPDPTLDDLEDEDFDSHLYPRNVEHAGLVDQRPGPGQGNTSKVCMTL